MPNNTNCDNLMFFFAFCDPKLNASVFCNAGHKQQVIWRQHLGLLDTVIVPVFLELLTKQLLTNKKTIFLDNKVY